MPRGKSTSPPPHNTHSAGSGTKSASGKGIRSAGGLKGCWQGELPVQQVTTMGGAGRRQEMSLFLKQLSTVQSSCPVPWGRVIGRGCVCNVQAWGMAHKCPAYLPSHNHLPLPTAPAHNSHCPPNQSFLPKMKGVGRERCAGSLFNRPAFLSSGELFPYRVTIRISTGVRLPL